MSSFDQIYSSNEAYFGSDPLPELQAHLLSLADITNIKVLDLGCGQGRDTLFAAKMGAYVVAIDESTVAVQQIRKVATENSLRIESHAENFLDCELQNEKFDVIVARTSLDHLEFEKCYVMAARMFELLRPEGKIFVTVFGENDPGAKNMDSCISDCAEHVRCYYSRQSLESIFRAFEIESCDVTKYLDDTHGEPHYHEVITLVANKPLGVTK